MSSAVDKNRPFIHVNVNEPLPKPTRLVTKRRKKQTYHNYTRLTPVYHLFLLPLSIGFLGLSVYLFYVHGYQQGNWTEAIGDLLAGCVGITVVILTRSYAVKIQNRTIRQEIRLRYFITAGKPFNDLERRLSLPQLLVLRFASDAELVTLANEAVQEHLPAAEIKRRIRRWRSDYHRV